MGSFWSCLGPNARESLVADAGRQAFVMAFSEYLKRWRVDDLDKSDRAKLLQIMEDRPGVEEWRATLPDQHKHVLVCPSAHRSRYRPVILDSTMVILSS